MDCIKIAPRKKLTLSKRKGLPEVLFSLKWSPRIDFPGRPIFTQFIPERLVEVPLPHAVHRVHRVLEHHVQVAAVDDGNI